MQARDKERRLELDGVVYGLERALDIVNIVEEEQVQPAPHPLPKAHSKQPSPGGKPRKARIVDEKLLIDGDKNMSEEIEEDQEEKYTREAQNPEGTQAQDKPTI